MGFRALVTEKPADGSTFSSVQTLDEVLLPDGNVTVDVEWACLNYKDGLCLAGKGGLVRHYPHVAGIDFAGVVRASEDGRYQPGHRVVLTGWRVGEAHWGGYAERARVEADWLVPVPAGLSTRQAMILGTAGLTAMLAIIRLEEMGTRPGKGEILVTGAAGGVGSIAVFLLARLGYKVVALSGRAMHAQALEKLGAGRVLRRQHFLAEADKPLESVRWAGAIDCVGGAILAKLLRQVDYGGSVAALGNAAGIEVPANVLPFILRGINLLGIDSVMQPFERRRAAWARLAELFDFAAYTDLVTEIGLDDLATAAAQILDGRVHGRVVVRIA